MLEKSTDPAAQFWIGGSRLCWCTVGCCAAWALHPQLPAALPLVLPAAAVPIHPALPPAFHSLCMLCLLEPRIGAAQSVLGASAERHDRMPHGAKLGARWAEGRVGEEGMFSDLYSFCTLVHKQEEAGPC